MMLLTAPAIAGYLPEPFPAAVERLVRAIVPAETTITIRHDYPYWTGQGSVLVMHITVTDPATGVERSAIPNAPKNHWRLKDVRDFAEYTSMLIRNERQRLHRQQQQAHQRELEAQKRLAQRRAAYRSWFDREAKPATEHRRSSRVIDARGKVWIVQAKTLTQVILAELLTNGSTGDTQAVNRDTPLVAYPRKVEQYVSSLVYRG